MNQQPIPMSTQKKDNNPEKGQNQPIAGNKGGGAPDPRAEGTTRKGDDGDKQRKGSTMPTPPKGKANDRTNGERDKDTKRPAHTNTKNR